MEEGAAVRDSGPDCSGACCSATWAVVEVDLVEEDSAAVVLVEAAVVLAGLVAGAREAAGRSAVIRKRESRWFRRN